MKKIRWVGAAIGLGWSVLVLLAYTLGFLETLELKMLDARFKLRGPIPRTDQVVIVAVDEESIAEYGRWPWERSLHARLVDRLTKAGAKVIAFDIFFVEPDKRDPEQDRALVEATRRSRRVVHNMFFDVDRGKIQKGNLPLPDLSKYASAIGFANVFPEIDGVIRKIPLSLTYEDIPYPHLGLAILSAYKERPWGELIQGLPADENNEMLINYTGGYRTFPYVSYRHVLNGQVPDAMFKGRIVLVGYDAAGLGDKPPTPYAAAAPGVEVHAHVISSILNKNTLRPSSPGWIFLLVPLFGVGLGLFLPMLSPWVGTGIGVAVLTGYFTTIQLFFSQGNRWLESVPQVLTILGTFGGVVLLQFMSEEREKRRVKKTFGQYVSPHVMEEVLSNPASLGLGGARKNLTVLFSDIRGFTTLAEQLQPEAVVALLNEYLSRMTTTVFKYEGTLDKFIGDAIMAFWGAPIPQADHARRAVLCALEMLEELKGLQDKWRSEGRPAVDIGIGINTGEMIIGNMGSADRMDYTVIGDNVNLASRLEALNKQYNTRFIISDSVYAEVKELVEVKSLGRVQVKGRGQEVGVYEVKGLRFKVGITMT